MQVDAPKRTWALAVAGVFLCLLLAKGSVHGAEVWYRLAVLEPLSGPQYTWFSDYHEATLAYERREELHPNEIASVERVRLASPDAPEVVIPLETWWRVRETLAHHLWPMEVLRMWLAGSSSQFVWFQNDEKAVWFFMSYWPRLSVPVRRELSLQALVVVRRTRVMGDF